MKLKLRNFQCHRQAELELSPLTFLVGPSNTGKSAYVRAIGFLTGQLSLGANRLVTRGQKTMSVELSTPEHTYERVLDKEGVHCRIDDTVYPRMGINVPDEFTKLATIQFQFEPFFLITDTPSDVFKKISSVLDLEKLDAVTKLITTDFNALRAQLKLDTESLQELSQRLKTVADLHRQYTILEQIRCSRMLELTQDLRRKLTLVHLSRYQFLNKLRLLYISYITIKFLYLTRIHSVLRSLITYVKAFELRQLLSLQSLVNMMRLKWTVLRLQFNIYRVCLNHKLLERIYFVGTNNRILLNFRKFMLYIVYLRHREKYLGKRIIFGIYGLYLHLLRLLQISKLERLNRLIEVCQVLDQIRNRKCPTCGQRLPEVNV